MVGIFPNLKETEGGAKSHSLTNANVMLPMNELNELFFQKNDYTKHCDMVENIAKFVEMCPSLCKLDTAL